MDYDILSKLVEEKLSINQISKKTNLSFTTVRYWLKKYNLKTQGYILQTNWNKKSIEIVMATAVSKSDILRKLGLKINSGNFQTLEKYCSLYDIDISQKKFDHKSHSKIYGFQKKLMNDEIFCLNSVTDDTKTIKKRAIEEGFLKNECYECSSPPIWNKKPLKLHLDHINGNRRDNRIVNLRILCPNCHSLTDNYRGSKKKV